MTAAVPLREPKNRLMCSRVPELCCSKQNRCGVDSPQPAPVMFPGGRAFHHSFDLKRAGNYPPFFQYGCIIDGAENVLLC